MLLSLPYQMWFPIAVAALAVAILASFISRRRAVGNISGLTPLFDPYGMPGALLPTTWWNGGSLLTWNNRRTLYSKGETLSIVPIFPGGPYIFTSSMDILRQVTALRGPFDKNNMAVQGLMLYGNNLATSFQDQWPRHRRVVNPAFNNKVYVRVWEQSVVTFKDMSSNEGWDMKDTLDLADVQPIVGKFALLLITAVGFGLPLAWAETPGSDVGNDMSLLTAFNKITANVILRLAAPKWLYKFPIQELQNTQKSYEKILSVMQGMIATRRRERADITATEKEDENQDIFSLLLKANESESEKNTLSDQELISNVFLLLFAGHETSAKTMGATLGLLACNPDRQEEAYQYIKSVLPDGRDPTYEDYDELQPILGCLLEALRLFPTAPMVIRHPTEPTPLTLDAEGRRLVLPPNVTIVCDLAGIAYNPRYYPNPAAYLPSRWEKAATDQASFQFGAGGRACLGRKFALIEMTCFLTLFLRDWKVEPILRKDEDMEGWRQRVLEESVTIGITMGPGKVPVKMTRRV